MTAMTDTAATGTAPPRSAFAALLRTEARLLLREPLALFWGVAFPLVLLAVMGSFGSRPDPQLGGLRLVDVYAPVLIAFTTAALGLQGLPAVLAGYRDRGVLRRLATTPVGPARLVGAQLVLNLGVVVCAAAGIVVVGRSAFDVPVPVRPGGFLLAVVLTGAAMLALGLAVAALTPSARSAGAVGTIAFFPMMFFAGLWVPRALMPELMRRIGDWTPLGAAVRAMQEAMFGAWPSWSSLAVLAGTAVVGTAVAARWFRWQ